MNNDLEIFNYFVDDILSSDAELLKNELDFLLMQYLFQSIDLEVLREIDCQEDVFLASLLGRLVELEANLVVKEIRKKPNMFNKIKKKLFKS